jgi:hypothetical protein
MRNNFENINIGKLIYERVTEFGIDKSRICRFLNCSEYEVDEMYKQQDMPTDIILKWSKLLEYDFFRIYTQHLILYSPPRSTNYNHLSEVENSKLPQFRKNIYTREMIDFILEMIEREEKTKDHIIEEYKIPKTTLYKWISKYKK